MNPEPVTVLFVEDSDADADLIGMALERARRERGIVRARDPALDQRMRDQLQASIDAIRAIPAPFDQAILGADSAPGRVAIARGIASLRMVRDSVVQVATLLGLRLTLEG